MVEPRPIRILMAEDSPSDAALAKEAFKNGKLLNELVIVGDGEECIEYLKKEGQYKDATRPDVLLLDLNMPKKNGLEVLADIKKNDDLKTIPVIILTTSESEHDIIKSYQLQASTYITKPVEFENFLEVAKQIKEFYFHVVTLPPNGDT